MNDTLYFPTVGTGGKKPILLALDDALLPFKKNLCFYMSKPKVRKEPILVPTFSPDAPDNKASHFYGTVLQDEGKFRMWYYAVGDGMREGPVCYAESMDGLKWIKPNLGQCLINGSRNNNGIYLTDKYTEGVFIIKDDEDPDPARRYKMVFEELPVVAAGDKGGSYSVSMAVSPDGINWTICSRQPIDEGLEPCAFYKYKGMYIINAQFAPSGVSEGGSKAGRQGHAWVSPDFDNWLEESVASFTLPEHEDRNNRGLDKSYLQVHLGTAAMAYDNVLVGLYCRWHAFPSEYDWFGRGKTFGDFGIVVGHDGLRFHEPVKGFVYLSGKESPVTPYFGKEPVTILCQANGILNVGDETRIYHGRWRNGTTNDEYYGEIGLATLPRDRWCALGLYPGKQRGAVWSAPIEIPNNGVKLTLNADLAENMAIELSDERFSLLEHFSGEFAGRAMGNGFDIPVVFPKETDQLGGRKVRIKISFTDEDKENPRLYAINLETLK
jgi:hypothetical protein